MRLTQPFVAPPVSACRKIAEPRPGTTGLALYSMTAKYAYARVDLQSASLRPPNGGRAPQRTWRKRLYVGDAGPSSYQSPQTSRWKRKATPGSGATP